MARTQDSYPETIVSNSMRIEGELKSNGNIKIDGNITGKVHTSQDLSIGPNAEIDADLVANNAMIAGVVKGNVNVKGSLTITETGRLLGNVNCGQIAIERGAYFAGNCRMQEPKTSVAVTTEDEE